jgi:hypothetical protein
MYGFSHRILRGQRSGQMLKRGYMSMGLQQRYGTTARPFCSQATMPYSKGLNFANNSHTSISLLHHHKQQQRLYSPCKDLGRLTPEVSLSILDTW